MIIKLHLDKDADKELYNEMMAVPLKRRATRLRVLATLGMTVIRGGSSAPPPLTLNIEQEAKNSDLKKDKVPDRTASKKRTRQIIKSGGF